MRLLHIGIERHRKATHYHHYYGIGFLSKDMLVHMKILIVTVISGKWGQMIRKEIKSYFTKLKIYWQWHWSIFHIRYIVQSIAIFLWKINIKWIILKKTLFLLLLLFTADLLWPLLCDPVYTVSSVHTCKCVKYLEYTLPTVAFYTTLLPVSRDCDFSLWNNKRHLHYGCSFFKYQIESAQRVPKYLRMLG